MGSSVIIGMLVFIVVVAFLFVVSESVRRGNKKCVPSFEKESKSNKHWSKEELYIVIYYILFEKEGAINDIDIINTLSDGLGRSTSSILKKISLIENINNIEDGSYNLIKESYNELSSLEKDEVEIKLQESIEKVIG